MVRVSVIVPVFNREKLVSRAIDSVLGQQGCDFELIVVDDGSTDGTWDVLLSFGDSLKAIRQENGGRSSARNRGLAEARGEFVAFLDSDDSWHERKLERQLKWHEEHLGFVASAHGIEVMHEDGRVEERLPRCDKELLERAPYEAVMDHFAFFPSVVMARRDVAERVGGFREDCHGAEDLDFALKLALEGPVGVFGAALTRMYQHGGQTGKKQLARENVKVLTKHLELYAERFSEELKKKLRKKIARYLLSVAKRAGSSERGDLLEEALVWDASLRYKPVYWRSRVKGWFGA